jgi:hypothetical protein
MSVQDASFEYPASWVAHTLLSASLELLCAHLIAGSLRMDVPQSHQPVQQCLLGLSAADLPASLVKACTKACLHGARHKVTASKWRGNTSDCFVWQQQPARLLMSSTGCI